MCFLHYNGWCWYFIKILFKDVSIFAQVGYRVTRAGSEMKRRYPPPYRIPHGRSLRKVLGDDFDARPPPFELENRRGT